MQQLFLSVIHGAISPYYRHITRHQRKRFGSTLLAPAQLIDHSRLAGVTDQMKATDPFDSENFAGSQPCISAFDGVTYR